MNNVNSDKQLAKIESGGVSLTLPENVQAICDKNGNLQTLKTHLQVANRLPIDKKQKLTNLVKSLGDAGKAQKKAYNAAKPIWHRLMRQVVGMYASDPRFKLSHKAMFNAKGQFIGGNMSARWDKTAVTNTDLVDTIAKLQARIAELENVPALTA